MLYTKYEYVYRSIGINTTLKVLFPYFKLPVAVKTLRGGGSRYGDVVTEFLQEVSTMQSLDHPNIIHLYGVVLTHPLKMVNFTFL